MPDGPLLGVALDGAGAHPAAWRAAGAADGLFTAERLVRLARAAEDAGLDFVTLDDGFDPPAPGSATLPGRLDALLALARVAPGHDVDRPRPDGHDDAHRAVPHLQEHRHARPRLRRPGRLARGGVDHGRGGHGVRPHRPPTARRAVGGGRRRRSRSSAGCGTAGRTTPSSATGPPAGTSTATSCTTSTSRAVLQRARPVDHAAVAAGPTARGDRPPAAPDATAVAARRADIVLVDAGDGPFGAVAPARPSAAWSATPAGTPTPSRSLAVVRIGEPGLRAELDRLVAPTGAGRRASTSSAMPRPSPPRCGRGPTRTPSTASCSARTCCRRRSTGSSTTSCRGSIGRRSRPPAERCATASGSAPGQPLRRRGGPDVSGTQADPPRRPLPRRQQHDRVERPDVGQPDRLRLVRAPRPHGRARQVRLLLPRRRPPAARAPGPHLRPRRRRPARLADRARRAGRRDRPHRAGGDAEHDVQRAVRAGPPVRHARSPEQRPGRLERRHLTRRVHR